MGIDIFLATCCKRRQVVAGDEEGLRGTAIVTVRNLAGNSIVYEEVSVHSPLQELRAFVKEKWGMPVAAQRLVLNGKTVEAPGSQAIGRALQVTDGGEVEVSCIRTELPHEEQRRVDEALLLAAARGDCAAIAELIADGARPAGLTRRPREEEEGEEGESLVSEPSDTEGGRSPSPLLLARVGGHKAAVQLLLDHGAPEPHLKPRQWSSMGRALGQADYAEAARLLAHKADPNTRLHRGEGILDTSSGSPLHACCAQHKRPGTAALAELLLHLGADHSIADSEGDTPMAHARYFGADNVRDVLKAHGAKVAGPYYSTLFTAHRRLFGIGG